MENQQKTGGRRRHVVSLIHRVPQRDIEVQIVGSLGEQNADACMQHLHWDEGVSIEFLHSFNNNHNPSTSPWFSVYPPTPDGRRKHAIIQQQPECHNEPMVSAVDAPTTKCVHPHLSSRSLVSQDIYTDTIQYMLKRTFSLPNPEWTPSRATRFIECLVWDGGWK